MIRLANDQGVNEVEGQAQPVATPATEEKVPAEPKVEEQSPTTEGTDELGLPKDASERTRQRVQELLEENKQLKEAQNQAFEPVYEPIRPVAPRPVQGVPAKVDEYGNVNPAYVEYIEQRQAATEQAVITNLTRAEAREAENAHPDIKTDSELLNMARAVKTDSLVYPENYKQQRELSLKEALDFVKGKVGKTAKSITPEVTLEKEQASLGAEGRSSQGVKRDLSDEEYESLRWETAKGNKDAMIARMKNIPAVNNTG